MREHRVTVHMHVCLVALGSALGGVARYLVSQGLGTSVGFPWSTLGVNVAGSLAIGLISGALAHATGNVAAVRAFAVVGFCGGFTTFSTFSNEMFHLLEGAQYGHAVLYASLSIFAGLAAVGTGYLLTR